MYILVSTRCTYKSLLYANPKWELAPGHGEIDVTSIRFALILFMPETGIIPVTTFFHDSKRNEFGLLNF